MSSGASIANNFPKLHDGIASFNGFNFGLAGVPAAMPGLPGELCWTETCANLSACRKRHLSLNAAPQHLPYPASYAYPLLAQHPAHLLPAHSASPLHPLMPCFNPFALSFPGSAALGLSANSSRLLPPAPQSSTKEQLRHILEQRHKSLSPVDSARLIRGRGDSDSGNESANGSGSHESPKKEKGGRAGCTRPSTTSPPSDADHKSSSSSVASGSKSPRNCHSILASLLRGEDFSRRQSRNCEISRENSPNVKFEKDNDSPPSDSTDHDGDASSEGSGPSDCASVLALLKPPPAHQTTFAAQHNQIVCPKPTRFSMNSILSQQDLLQFGESRRCAPDFLLPNFANLYPFDSSPSGSSHLPVTTSPYHYPSIRSNGAFLPLPRHSGQENDQPEDLCIRKLPRLQESLLNEKLSDKLPSSAQPATLFPEMAHSIHIHLDEDSVGSGTNADSQQSTPISPESSASGTSTGSSLTLQSAASGNCVVCSDKSSGFHYGVVSCEGCKGFFRRTVQKNIEYQCHKDAKCPVNRFTRNRCQSCRFNKCLFAGMSKESVRQDRNRKRKANDEQSEVELQKTAELQQLIAAVVAAHNATMPSLQMGMSGLSLLSMMQEDLSNRNNHSGIGRVVEFCLQVPCLPTLDQHDQLILMRHACLEIWIFRCAFLLCGRPFPPPRNGTPDDALWSKHEALVQCVARLRDSLTQLQLFNEELALLCAVCLLCSTRPGLKQPELVEKCQEPLVEALRVQVQLRQSPAIPPDGVPSLKDSGKNGIFAKLLMKISDVRAIVLKELDASEPIK